MKFAHMADCHIGAWRDPKLKDLPIEAFTKAIDICIGKSIDFIIIAGDLFNTALPGIDNLKVVAKKFKQLKELHISIYIIPGSHDFSPSGKTMIDVLEEAGLVINLVKGRDIDGVLNLDFTLDKKTGVKLTGMLGKRGILEKNYYENLDIDALEKEPGTKIFVFHGPIRELLGMDLASMDAYDLSYLPKDFEYYAGGHIHIINEYSNKHYKKVVYPGPLFPASFSELESLGTGGFFIYEDGVLQRHDIPIKNVMKISVDAEHKSPEEVESLILDAIKNKEYINTIVLLRVSGKLKTGKVSDINFKDITSKIYTHGAFYVMRNTNRLSSEEFDQVRIQENNPEDIEDSLVKEHLGQIHIKGMNTDKEFLMIKDMIKIFSQEKHEGEKVYEYEDRIKTETDKLFDI